MGSVKALNSCQNRPPVNTTIAKAFVKYEMGVTVNRKVIRSKTEKPRIN